MNKKVILIEDDKDLQEIIKYNFSKEKYETKQISDLSINNIDNFLKGYQNNQDNRANEYEQLFYMRKNQDKFSKEIYDEETKKLETKQLEEAKLLQSMDIRLGYPCVLHPPLPMPKPILNRQET